MMNNKVSFYLRSTFLRAYGSMRNFSSKQIDEDIALYNNFKSSFIQIEDKFHTTDRNKVLNMKTAKLIPDEHEELSLYGYFNLQNPLLSKYGIDPAEVLSGAAMAFTNFHPIELSPEHYIDEKYHKEREFLKEFMTPSKYEWCSTIRKFSSDAGYFNEVTQFKLNNARLIGMTTQFANKDRRLNRIDRERFLKERIYMGENFNRNLTEPLEEDETEEEVNLNMLQQLLINQAQHIVVDKTNKYLEEFNLNPPPDHDYPPGSVVALADILFDYQIGMRTYYRPPGTQEKIYMHPRMMVHRVELMQFQACISGQVPLAWLFAK